jgi:branched-subunit amino acid ABC-type transport system permease component
MRAVSDNKELAAACGLDIRSVTYASWLISGLLAGLAGVMLAIHSHTFDTTLGDTNIYLVFGAVVIGGIGRPAGAVAGAVIIGLSTQWAVPVIGAALSPTVVFALLVLLMIFRPNGVFGSTGRSQFANA